MDTLSLLYKVDRSHVHSSPGKHKDHGAADSKKVNVVKVIRIDF